MSKNSVNTNSIFEQLTNKKIIPILVEYEPFNKLISAGTSPQMDKFIKELKSIITKEKEILLDIRNLDKEKQRTTARVLYYSGQVNSSAGGSPSDLKKLENERIKINEKNKEINERKEVIQDLLVKKEELNLALLKETVAFCYKNMDKDENKLQEVLKEIDITRKKLEEYRVQRDSLQERINATYSFIHSLLGSKATEKIDSKLIEEK